MWERHDGDTTSSEERASDEGHEDDPADGGDPQGQPVDPPSNPPSSEIPTVSVQERVIHIELILKYGNGPPLDDETEPRMPNGGAVLILTLRA
eukprot:4551362-Amphidinium_carterae.1